MFHYDYRRWCSVGITPGKACYAVSIWARFAPLGDIVLFTIGVLGWMPDVAPFYDQYEDQAAQLPLCFTQTATKRLP